ncbi:hydantoinase/oxoprolinase N-terminal domain-containing protein [Streptosporangium lutulentum]
MRRASAETGAESGMEAVSAVVHGTTVATNQLLEDRIADLGFITTEGFEFILEIARQSVPDGYGNSYFWVKPPRIVPVHRIKTVGGRLDHTGAEVRPFDEAQAVAAARWFRERGSPRSGCASSTPTPTPAMSCACARSLSGSTPARSSRSPATCCVSTASTNGRSPRWWTPRSSRPCAATSPTWPNGWRRRAGAACRSPS